MYSTSGKQSGLVQELCRLQVRESLLQLVLRLFGDRLQQRERHVDADHGRRLEQMLFQRRQAIDARRQDGLHGGRNLDARERFGQPIASALADEHLRFGQGADAFLEEERVALGLLDQAAASSGRKCSSAPSSPSSRSSQLDGGNGSMRSCV